MKWFILTIFFSLCAHAETLLPYTVYLRPGKKLFSIKNQEEWIISKGIYAKVLELDVNRRDQFYVFDKNGKAQYLTDSTGLIEIDKDVNLLPIVDAEKIYPTKSVFKTENKIANFDSQITLHLENFSMSDLGEIYNDEIHSTVSNRYEIRTLYNSNLPFNFGLTFNYQSAYWKSNLSDLKLSILSFGPIFQYVFHKSESVFIKGLLSAETAPIYAVYTNTTDHYAGLLFDGGLECEWKSFLGTMSIGSHYRRHSLKLLAASRENSNLYMKDYTLNSLGISVGYVVDWSL